MRCSGRAKPGPKEEIMKVLPFDNTLLTLKMTGARQDTKAGIAEAERRNGVRLTGDDHET